MGVIAIVCGLVSQGYHGPNGWVTVGNTTMPMSGVWKLAREIWAARKKGK